MLLNELACSIHMMRWEHDTKLRSPALLDVELIYMLLCQWTHIRATEHTRPSDSQQPGGEGHPGAPLVTIERTSVGDLTEPPKQRGCGLSEALIDAAEGG